LINKNKHIIIVASYGLVKKTILSLNN